MICIVPVQVVEEVGVKVHQSHRTLNGSILRNLDM